MADDDLVAALRAAGCVFAEDEARLLREQAATPEELAELLRRRVAGEPLEHVLGWAEFAGLRIPVGPGVFVPRRRTALLVDEAVAVLEHVPRAVVVDVCCGSGSIAAALAARLGRRDVELHAADIDPAAVRAARVTLDGLAEVHEGDLLDALPDRLRSAVDVIVASPPYVPSEAVRFMPPEARDHEPRIALDGGVDGLDVVRRLAGQATAWLAPGGHLLVDLGQSQAAIAVAVLADAGFSARVTSDDDLGATLVVARLPSRSG